MSIIFEFIFKIPNILCLCQNKFATRQSCDDATIMCLVMFLIVAGGIYGITANYGGQLQVSNGGILREFPGDSP